MQKLVLLVVTVLFVPFNGVVVDADAQSSPTAQKTFQPIVSDQSSIKSSAKQAEDPPFELLDEKGGSAPKSQLSPAFHKALAQALGLGEKPYVYLQLKRQPSAVERERLAMEGLALVSYIGSYTWCARVTDANVLPYLLNADKRRVTPLRLIQSVREIRPEDRVSSRVLQQATELPDTASRYVIIQFHEDIPLEEVVALVESAGGEDIREIKPLNSLQVKGTSTMINLLMGLEAVRWITVPPAAGSDDNDGARAAMNVDDIQGDPYNLDGSGAKIGQWESGYADPRHEDLSGRITLYDGSIDETETVAEITDHATHVAGTMVGDGGLSESVGDTPYQWRGMAPNAEVISFVRPTLADGRTTDLAELSKQFSDATDPPYDIALANHSWRMGRYNEESTYDNAAELYDYVVRPSLGVGIPLITSAGNVGAEIGHCSEGWTTLSTPNAAKNTIQVGAIPSSSTYVIPWSSRGPTLDGRLKPDLVAVGTGELNGVKSTIPDTYIDEFVDPVTGETLDCAPGVAAQEDPPEPNTEGDDYCYPYDLAKGTSMAAAATSGVAALLLQDWWDTHPRGPFPSTIKAILVHTADDVTNLAGCREDYFGPDYFSGYGRVNAHTAIMPIRAKRRVQEGVIESVDEEDIYAIESSLSTLKVTLVWDDKPADPSLEEQAKENGERADLLVNDLDLLLISPDGTAFHPPWDLNPDDPEQPAVANSYADESTASQHRDSVNVVEQVFVQDAAPGVWTIKVKAHDMVWGEQRYSLVANSQIIRLDPPKSSGLLPGPYDIMDDPLYLMDCGLCKECFGRLCDPRVNPEFDLFLVLTPDPEPAAVSFRYSELGLKDKERPFMAAAQLDGWNGQRVFAASAPYADSAAPDAGAVIFFDRSGKVVVRVDGIARGEHLGVDMDVRGNDAVVASTRRIVRIEQGKTTFDMDLEKSAAARRGVEVAFTEDIDGDRKPEILVGLPYADAGKLTEAGQILVIGSSSARVVDVVYGKKAGQHLGTVLQPITLK